MIRAFGSDEIAVHRAGGAVDAAAHGLLPSSAAAPAGLAIALAAPRRSLAARVATGYIQLFQGTPLLMQLFLVFFGANLFGGSIDRCSPPPSR